MKPKCPSCGKKGICDYDKDPIARAIAHKDFRCVYCKKLFTYQEIYFRAVVF